MEKRLIEIIIKNNDQLIIVDKPSVEEAEKFKKEFLELVKQGEEYFVFDNCYGDTVVLKISEVTLLRTRPY